MVVDLKSQIQFVCGITWWRHGWCGRPEGAPTTFNYGGNFPEQQLASKKCKTVGIHNNEDWLHLHSKGSHVFLLKLSSQMALHESCLSWRIRAEFQGMIRLKHSWRAYLLLENLPVPPSPTSTSLKVGMSSPVAILGLNQISAILGTGITPLRAFLWSNQ